MAFTPTEVHLACQEVNVACVWAGFVVTMLVAHYLGGSYAYAGICNWGMCVVNALGGHLIPWIVMGYNPGHGDDGTGGHWIPSKRVVDGLVVVDVGGGRTYDHNCLMLGGFKLRFYVAALPQLYHKIRCSSPQSGPLNSYPEILTSVITQSLLLFAEPNDWFL